MAKNEWRARCWAPFLSRFCRVVSCAPAALRAADPLVCRVFCVFFPLLQMVVVMVVVEMTVCARCDFWNFFCRFDFLRGKSWRAPLRISRGTCARVFVSEQMLC